MSLTILDALDDPRLFGSAFPGPTWNMWRVLLAALCALPPRDGDLEIFRALTGRTTWPTKPFSEGWFAMGRRAAKSRIGALLAVFTCCFRDWASALAPGERGVFMILAADKRQAGVCFRYVEALVDGAPMLSAMVERRTSEAIYFTNRTAIEVHVSNYRSVRGPTLIGVICDEISFWRSDDSANPDAEVIAALKPAMATIDRPLLLAISSPYARSGELWRAYRAHYGNDDSDVLVAQATSRMMNPTLSEALVERALAEDEPRARAEWLAEFRSDVETFLTRESVESAIVPGRYELPANPSATWAPSYSAHCDPSGGSADSAALCICHAEGERVVIDLLREVRAPHSPSAAIEGFAEDLRRFHLSQVSGDRYSAGFVVDSFASAGIRYVHCEKTTSGLYAELLPMMNAGRVELIDHPRLVAQLCALERRTSRGGRDLISHPPGGHDDLCTALAGAVYSARGDQSQAYVWGSRRMIRPYAVAE